MVTAGRKKGKPFLEKESILSPGIWTVMENGSRGGDWQCQAFY